MDVMDITLETLLTTEIPDCLVCGEETGLGSFYCSYHMHVLDDDSLEAAMGWVHLRQEERRSEAIAAEHEDEQCEDEYALHMEEEWRKKWQGTKIRVAHMFNIVEYFESKHSRRQFLMAKVTSDMGPTELIMMGRLLYWLEIHDVVGLSGHLASLTIRENLLVVTWNVDPIYEAKKMLDLAWKEQGGDRVDHSNHWGDDVTEQETHV
jgi:hypothetical protein